MKVDGFKFQDTLTELQKVRTTLREQLTNVVYAFADEEKPDFANLADALEKNEYQIARLQVAQTLFNTNVKVKVAKLGEISLLEAVKLVSVAGRVEAIWRTAISSEKSTTRRYGHDPHSRSKDDEYAKRTIEVQTCIENAADKAGVVQSLKQALRHGNATQVEMNLDENLFNTSLNL